MFSLNKISQLNLFNQVSEIANAKFAFALPINVPSSIYTI